MNILHTFVFLTTGKVPPRNEKNEKKKNKIKIYGLIFGGAYNQDEKSTPDLMGLQPGGLITGRAYNRGDYNRDLTVIRLLKRIANIF